jgi:hypothetical protein
VVDTAVAGILVKLDEKETELTALRQKVDDLEAYNSVSPCRLKMAGDRNFDRAQEVRRSIGDRLKETYIS